MFCIKCGANNSDQAVYCQKCGTMLEAEEETRIVQKKIQIKDEDEENEIFSIRPTLMFVKFGYILAIGGAFLLVALLAAFGLITQISISSVLVVLFGLSLLLIPAFYHLKNKTVKYTLTDSKVEINKGLISHTTRNLPLRSIQDVIIRHCSPTTSPFGDVIENATEKRENILKKCQFIRGQKIRDMLSQAMRRLNK